MSHKHFHKQPSKTPFGLNKNTNIMEAFNPNMNYPFSYTFTTTSSSSTSCNNTITTTNVHTPTTYMLRKSGGMDSRIWSKLPQRLIDRVIAFLPPPAFIRSRVVCKRWYALLFSTPFLELYLQVSPNHHWFIFFKQNKSLVKNTCYIYDNQSGVAANNSRSSSNVEGFMFDPNDMVWYRLSFGLLPSGLSPVSSSGGLVCWMSDEAGPKNLILYNPIVSTLTHLPAPTLRPRLFPSIGLTVTPTSVDVSVAGDDLISPYAVKNLTTENFHIDGSGFYSIWGTTASLPRLCSLESGRMIYVRGRFYCMNYSPFSILSYDLATNIWSKIQAPMRRFLRSPNLIESGGKLILIAAVEKSKLNVPKSLRLWCLQSCGTTWVEIERMPQQLYIQFSEIEKTTPTSELGFECVGHGEFIVFLMKGGGGGGRGGDNKPLLLLFDMNKKRWQWIPQCPFIDYGDDGIARYGGGETLLNGFAYDPKLVTPVTSLLDQFTLPFQSF